jgi:hypothetical protein
MAVGPQTACPLPPIPYADWHSFGRTGRTSPMILTSTRFRRRPSRLTGQPVRLASKDQLPRAKDFGELSEAVKTAVGHRDHCCASRTITRNTRSCVPLQVRIGIPVPTSGTGVLARAGVPPVSRPAASGPAASWMEMRGVMFRALSRVSPLFVTYHTHTAERQGPDGDRPRHEQPQLLSFRVNGLLSCWHLVGCYAPYQTLQRVAVPSGLISTSPGGRK